MEMYEVFILISNKLDYDWKRLYRLAQGKQESPPMILSIIANGEVHCEYKNNDVNLGCFYIINEIISADDMSKKLEVICEKNKNKHLFVAVHNAVVSKIRNKLICNGMQWESFSHGPREPLWGNCISPFLDAVEAREHEKLGKSIHALLNYGKNDNIQRLRSNLLIPFIPFHLVFQVDTDLDTDLKDKLYTILIQSSQSIDKDSLNDNLAKLIHLAAITRDSRINLMNYLNKLIDACNGLKNISNIYDISEKKKDIIRDVEEFAECIGINVDNI